MTILIILMTISIVTLIATGIVIYKANKIADGVMKQLYDKLED